jgi:CPA1 family monovalent cation:H+ antiporter
MILLLSGILLIILLSRITEEALRIPFVLALILFSYGLQLSFPAQFAALGSNFDEILHLMLPIILLPDLLSLTIGEMRRHALTFLYLAVFSVIASIALAVLLTPLLMSEHAFTTGMLIALFSMLMATDAITVSSVFSRFPLPSKLKVYAEGESLFNDVTALIIFYFVALPLVTGVDVTLAGVNLAIFKVVTLSMVIGITAALLGYLALKLIKQTIEQFIIIYLVAILSFVAAEHLHISGILATVSAVIALKYAIDRELLLMTSQSHSQRFQDARSYYDMVVELMRRVPALTPRGFIAYKKESYYVGLFANAAVFISMANLLDLSVLLVYWQEILLVFLLTTAIRAIFVHPLVWMQQLPARWAHVLTLAGMKGGLAIIMVHSLPTDFAYLELFEAVVIGTVLLSIFLYSLLLIVYLRGQRRQFEQDRRQQDAGVDLDNLARQFRDVVEKDPETGIYIPSVFRDIVDSEVSRATRYGIDLSLITLRPDPDGQKRPLDQNLLALAQSVRKVTRSNDILGHSDSESIAVITPNTSTEGAWILLGRILEDTRKLEIPIQTAVAELEQGDDGTLLLDRACAGTVKP